MSTLAIDKGGPTRKVKYRSMSRDRAWALRWSYFFLVLFAIFSLTPPIYMLITSLKSSAEISAATNPWWVFSPTLANYVDLLTSNQFLRFFWNSAIVSIVVKEALFWYTLINAKKIRSGALKAEAWHHQIGRASCRERV